MNWFRSFLEDFMPKRGVPSIPNPPSPAPVAPKPEPSCFAKGITRSIEMEPERWETVPCTSYITSGWYHVLAIEHAKTKVHLEGQQSSYGDDSRYHRLAGCQYLSSIEIVDHPLSDADCILIAQTIEAHPVGQLKKTIATERKRAVLQKAAQDHFTNLGCPTDSSIS